MDNTEELVSCPYNSNHRFTRAKLLFHIHRCKDKAMVGHLYTTCKFNTLHIVKKQKLVLHYQTCEDRIRTFQMLQKIDLIKQQLYEPSQNSQDSLQIVKVSKTKQEAEESKISYPQVTETKQIDEIKQCAECGRLLTLYFRSNRKNQELDKLIMKFEALTADLIKLEEQ